MADLILGYFNSLSGSAKAKFLIKVAQQEGKPVLTCSVSWQVFALLALMAL